MGSAAWYNSVMNQLLIGKPTFSRWDILLILIVACFLTLLFILQLNNLNMKIRDARRISDLEQIQKALVQYSEDNKHLPAPATYKGGGKALAPGGWDYSSIPEGMPQFVSFLNYGDTKYLTNIPLDPINNGTGNVLAGGSGYAYAYRCGSDGLYLAAKLESPDAFKETGRLVGQNIYAAAWQTPINFCKESIE